MEPYPETAAERTRWILARRPARQPVDPRRPYAFLREREPGGDGLPVEVATVFLSNRECPWRCLMCDLWRNTLEDPVQPGDIPAQIDHAMAQFVGPDSAPPVMLKLYNAGSFFDPRAIPPGDLAAIADRAASFQRVVVECHPSLVGNPCVRFRDALAEAAARRGRSGPRLEMAMGLETAHPAVLKKLNKRMTVAGFCRAARFLRTNAIDLRVFVLVKPPFMDEREALRWAGRSVDLAFDEDARVVSLIPVRPGNGALDSLAAQGFFAPPSLALLEEVHDAAVQAGRGVVLADTWDLQVFASCAECLPARRARMEAMNLGQKVLDRVRCAKCHARATA